MSVEALLQDKIKRFENIKNQLMDLNKQIGALSEQQKALYNQGLEMKGSIDTLLQIKEQEDKALSESKTAGLTLPMGVNPVVATPAAVPQEIPVESLKAPVTLEVK